LQHGSPWTGDGARGARRDEPGKTAPGKGKGGAKLERLRRPRAQWEEEPDFDLLEPFDSEPPEPEESLFESEPLELLLDPESEPESEREDSELDSLLLPEPPEREPFEARLSVL
jgi:hypothetical protein